MARYIDADALIEQMEADAEHMDDFIVQMMLYASINDVKHAPTADVVERKTGIWKDVYNGFGTCSVCDYRNVVDKFCPNCGSQMKGE